MAASGADLAAPAEVRLTAAEAEGLSAEPVWAAPTARSCGITQPSVVKTRAKTRNPVGTAICPSISEREERPKPSGVSAAAQCLSLWTRQARVAGTLLEQDRPAVFSALRLHPALHRV